MKRKEQLEAMTVSTLKSMAVHLGIKRTSKLKKAELISEILLIEKKSVEGETFSGEY